MENGLYAYADDSTLLAVVHKPADIPAFAAFLNRDLARIQEWCNRASPDLDILSVKFDSRFTFEDHVRGIVSRVSQRIGILRLMKCLCGHLCVASLLLCICSPNP